jgi:hypothetical protein
VHDGAAVAKENADERCSPDRGCRRRPSRTSDGRGTAPARLRRVAGWHDKIVARANQLIDGLINKGECDFVKDFALRYPTAIFLELMGLPLDRLDDFLVWETAILHPDVTHKTAPR